MEVYDYDYPYKGEPKKKKSKHILAKVLLITLTTVVVLPLALIYILLYDATPAEYKIKKSWDTGETINNVVVDAFDPAKENKLLNFKLDQSGLNELFYHATKEKINERAPFKQIEVKINENNYQFILYFDIGAFKTRAILDTTLNSFSSLEDQSIVFDINGFSIGRLNRLLGLGREILLRYITEDVLQNGLNSAGIHANVDFLEMKVTYPLINLYHDLRDIAGAEIENSEFFTAVIEYIINYRLASFEFYAHQAIENMINLEPLTRNTNFLTPEKNLNLDLQSQKEKLKTLLDNEIVTSDKSVDVFEYLIRGYDYASSESKTYIDTLDLTSIGINDNSTYTGVTLPSTEDIEVNLETEFSSQTYDDISTTPKLIGTLDENELNAFLANQNIIGHSRLLMRQAEDGYKDNYLSITGAYLNIYNGKLNIVIEVDLNGCKTYLILDTSKKSVSQYQLLLNIENVYFGQEICDVALKQELIKLAQSMLGDNDWFRLDYENNEVIIDIEKALMDSGAYASLESTGKDYEFDMTLTGSGLSATGELNIYVKEK